MTELQIIIFTLIRQGLGIEDIDHLQLRCNQGLPQGIWNTVKEVADKQAVSAIVFDGLDALIKKYGKEMVLSNNNIMWWQQFVFEWIGLSNNVEVQNEKLNKRTKEIFSRLKDAGFRCCILKGQGNARMYPKPASRIPGDIDVWVDGEVEAIKKYVRQLCPDAKDCEHHIDFPIYQDVDVEVHYKPRYLFMPKHNAAFEKWVQDNKRLQFCNKVNLADGSEIIAPTEDFNIVYQLVHMMGHFVEDGIGLRQITDYVCLLRWRSNYDVDFSNVFSQMGLTKFVQGLMWIAKEKYGLNTDCLVEVPKEKYGRIILNDVFETGNLGQAGKFLRSRGVLSYQHRIMIYLRRQMTIFPVTRYESIFNLLKISSRRILSA